MYQVDSADLHLFLFLKKQKTKKINRVVTVNLWTERILSLEKKCRVIKPNKFLIFSNGQTYSKTFQINTILLPLCSILVAVGHLKYVIFHTIVSTQTI